MIGAQTGAATLVLGLVAAGFILVAAGTWNAIGIVAGIPLDAVTWLGLRARASRRAGRLSVSTRRSSPAAPASSARTSCGRCSSAATTCACSTTSRPASRANLDGLEVEIVEGELRSYERVHNAVRGVEVVFHLGALGSVPRSVQDPLTSSAVNVEGTLNVLLAARDEGVRRVVFSSSTSVYGSSRDAADAREGSPPDPISPYGVAKLAAERYCIAFSRVYEAFETVVLRYFNVFGPRQSPTSQYAAVVPLLHHRDRRRPSRSTIHGDGEQSRDFTYVTTSSTRRSRAADAAGASGRVFNVAGGSPASVNRVADTIGEILGRPVEKVFAPRAAGRHPRLVGRPRPPRARRSATSRRSRSRRACAGRAERCSLGRRRPRRAPTRGRTCGQVARRNAANAGFFFPGLPVIEARLPAVDVRARPSAGTSSIRSIRGFARAIPNACVR